MNQESFQAEGYSANNSSNATETEAGNFFLVCLKGETVPDTPSEIEWAEMEKAGEGSFCFHSVSAMEGERRGTPPYCLASHEFGKGSAYVILSLVSGMGESNLGKGVKGMASSLTKHVT